MSIAMTRPSEAAGRPASTAWGRLSFSVTYTFDSSNPNVHDIGVEDYHFVSLTCAGGTVSFPEFRAAGSVNTSFDLTVGNAGYCGLRVFARAMVLGNGDSRTDQDFLETSNFELTVSFESLLDDAAPSLTIGDAAAMEGNSAHPGQVTFPVTLSSPASVPVTVGYATHDGTAQAGSDYSAASGSLTFATGETAKPIQVEVAGDTDIEADETFSVVLSGATNATIADGEGIGTIRNDDGDIAFDWTVPERFDGQDHDGNGLADAFAPDGRLDVAPARWPVDFTYTSSGACDPALTASWRIDGTAVSDTDPAIIDDDPTTCAFSYGFPAEGQYHVEMELRDTLGNVAGTQAHDVIVQDWLIVSIGDSVASGEGNPDIPGRRSARWENEQCHRSAAAGPAQAAIAIERADPKTSVTFIHLACSGAGIIEGLLGSYDGIVAGNALPPQLDALQTAVGEREIDAVLVSIGANDAHFSKLVKQCLLKDDCDGPAPDSAASKFARRLRRLPGEYDQLAGALNPLVSDSQRVLLTEYFDPTHGDGGAICADTILADLPVVAHLGLSITAAEATWAATTLLPGLNAAGASAATRNGWTYVGGIAAQFLTHGYCASDHWVDTYTESKARQGDSNGTLHPNASGQTAYGNRIGAALHDAFYTNGDLHQPRRPETADHSDVSQIATPRLGDDAQSRRACGGASTAAQRPCLAKRRRATRTMRRLTGSRRLRIILDAL
jgi:hypothetical protein